MRVELVMTGEELLDGRVLNSNERDIAQILLDEGISVLRSVTVGDRPDELRAVFLDVAERADIAIVTGGLGPTDDDRTAAILADLAGVPLIRNQAALAAIHERFARWGRTMTENNKKQADLPASATMIPNPHGTAPAFSLRLRRCLFFALPGVPREMKPLLSDAVLPLLRSLLPADHLRPTLRTFRCFGLGESQAADRLQDLYPLPPSVEIGYRAVLPEVHIKVALTALDPTERQVLLDSFEARIRERLGPYIYGVDREDFIQSLADLLRHKKKTLALAESCTGGLIARLLTAEAGASDFFLLGAVTYSNDAKASVLAVPVDLLEGFGAVSEPVARAMAEGARRVSQADLALAITGIAGPGGATPTKPVGTVHIALATKDQTFHRLFAFPGDRFRVQHISAFAALSLLRSYLLSGHIDIPIFDLHAVSSSPPPLPPRPQTE